MLYVFGTAISESDARYLLWALDSLGSPEAIDAAKVIALGITGQRNTIALSPAMQAAVYTALSDDLPHTLVELRSRLRPKTLIVKEW